MALLDIVDENDNIIGQREFNKIYDSLKTQNPCLFRTVSIFVITSEGKIVLQKRSNKVKVSPGLWESSATGHVEIGDDYETAAVKELEEELGIKIAKKDLIFINKMNPDRKKTFHFRKFFLCKHNGPFTPNYEVDGIKIMTINQIKNELKNNSKIYTKGFMENFDLYIKWLGNENKKDLSYL